MAEWTQCPSCNLKHAVRADGLCPRCRQPGAAAAAVDWASVTAPAASLAVAAPHAFTVGRFFSTTLSTWLRNAGWAVPVSLLVYLPLAVGMFRLYSRAPAARGSRLDLPWLALGFVLPVALMFLLMPLELLAIARAGVRRLREEPVALGDMLAAAARSYLPAVGLLLLVGLAYLGTACTIAVPLVLLSGWAASAPAMVTERLGPIAAMKRSWALTHGLKWQVFAGFLLLVLAMTAVAFVLQGALTAVAIYGSMGARGDPQLPLGALGAVQVVSVLLQGVESSVLTTATAVAYHQLRVAAEGPGSASLARVFE